jgi:uncharacterized protein YneF (UPF0154 family)
VFLCIAIPMYILYSLIVFVAVIIGIILGTFDFLIEKITKKS